MFLYDKFFEPLPDSLQEFKQKTNALFPHIYDTKHLINTRMQLKALFNPSSTGLSDAYDQMMRDEFRFDQAIMLRPQFSDYKIDPLNKLESKSHEAGFDAMMTGIIWFKL